MQCRECGYELWNLTEPRCPECGTAFDLRTYRFTPGTVAFACPHCGALHEGAGPNYVPAQTETATCQSCGEAMAVRRMRVAPLMANPPAALSSAMPWDERGRRGARGGRRGGGRGGGRWWAYWATIRMAMIEPTKLARQTRPDSGYDDSYKFACLAWLPGIVINVGLIALVVALIGGWSGSVNHWLWAGMGIFVLIAAACIFLGPLLATLLVAVPAQLFLMLFEPRRKRFTVTARSVNYAQAPMILMAIPLCGLNLGQSIGGVWMLVSAILQVKEAHATTGVKAALAVLWLPLLLFAVYSGGVGVLMRWH